MPSPYTIPKAYTVRVKDFQQDITHTLHEYAKSQNEANAWALDYLKRALGHDEFEIVGKRKVRRSRRPTVVTTRTPGVVKTVKFDPVAWRQKSKESLERIGKRFST